MSGESPAAVLFDSAAIEMAVVRGVPPPLGTRAYLVAGIDGAGNVQTITFNPDGSVTVTVVAPTTPVVTAVPQTIVSGALLAANPNRKQASIYNEQGVLYVKLGAGAALNDYSFAMGPGHLYELNFPVYVGQITGVWSSTGSGFARVTELT